MKQFDNRNTLKKNVHEVNTSYWIKQREIWYVYLGLNIGFEEDGKGDDFKRPVLVLKKIGNLFAVLPMTTKGKDSFFYHTLPKAYSGKTSRVILSQIRVIDKNRFIERMGIIKQNDFQAIKEKLKALLL